MYIQSVEQSLSDARAIAESLMRDECVVERRSGRVAQDESTGAESAVWNVVFTSKCRLRDQGFADSKSPVAGRVESLGTTIVMMPWNIGEVRAADRIRITGVGPKTASRHLGKIYVVRSDHDRSLATATRLVVKEST